MKEDEVIKSQSVLGLHGPKGEAEGAGRDELPARLPCPFCGGAAVFDHTYPDGVRFGCACHHEVFEDFIEAAAHWNRRAAEAAWQPIETAPMNRETVLLYEDGAVYAGYFFDDSWSSDCGQPVVYSPAPTHWMPLPEPPVAADRPSPRQVMQPIRDDQTPSPNPIRKEQKL